jgi:glycosyltransferase involved in cell wall biosynthesis/Tfp pilus assembly protein PilF
MKLNDVIRWSIRRLRRRIQLFIYGDELRQGQAAYLRGDFEKALAVYDELRTRVPKSQAAHYGWGLAALKLGREQDAIKAFEVAFVIVPPHPEAGLRLADILLAHGDAKSALDMYQQVINFAPDVAEAHYGRAVAALRLSCEQEAMTGFSRAWDAIPRHPEAGLRMAEHAMANGKTTAALDHYQSVIDIAPRLAEAHYGQGVALSHMGRRNEALRFFKQALAIKPAYADASAAAVFLNLFSEKSQRAPRRTRPFICLPILPFVRDWLGGQIYLANFADSMSRLPRAVRPRLIVIIAMDDWRQKTNLINLVDRIFSHEAVLGILDEKGAIIKGKALLKRIQRRLSARGKGMETLLQRVDWTFPLLYPCWSMVTAPGPLFWIPDLQHRAFPALFSPAEYAARERDMSALAGRTASIIFSSVDTQKLFDIEFPGHRSHNHIWNFVSLLEKTAQLDQDAWTALNLPARFFYTPNQFWPHKDYATLFKALRILLDEGLDVTFVCTGNPLHSETDPHARQLLALAKQLALKDHLRLLGVIPRATQIEILRRACAIIQPSLFEGWSTVIEDARALGRPLFVSNIPVHREQVGDEATFFTAGDPRSLADAILSTGDRLVPGPCPEREVVAARALQSRADASARQFLRILESEADRRLSVASKNDTSHP